MTLHSFCWNVRIDREEDSELIDWYYVERRTFSLYTTTLGDSPGGTDGRLSPEPVLGDSSSCHIWTPIVRIVFFFFSLIVHV